MPGLIEVGNCPSWWRWLSPNLGATATVHVNPRPVLRQSPDLNAMNRSGDLEMNDCRDEIHRTQDTK